MSGFVYAFGSAIFAATTDALSKKGLRQHSALVVAGVNLAYATPFLLPIVFYIEIPQLDGTFWATIFTLIPMEICAILLYMKALQISPLSLTVPFLSLTPAFSLAASFLILGEVPSLSGSFGVLLIVLGAYSLNVHQSKKGILEPLRAVLIERGSIMMVGVAFIYSITSNLGKLAIQHSSPAFMSLFYIPVLTLAFLPFLVRSGAEIFDLRAGRVLFVMIGVSQALATLCHFKAVSMMLVSYMISIKRLSLLLSVVYGGIFFHEEHLRERFFGSLLMLMGVLLIVLS